MPSSLWQLKAWPDSAMGSAGRIQQLSTDPTSINRKIMTETQVSGLCRYHLLWHVEKRFPATPRGKRLWPAGCTRQGWRLPHSLQGPQVPQRLSSFPGPAQACGRARSRLSSCCPPPSPVCAQLGDTGALCWSGDTQWGLWNETWHVKTCLLLMLIFRNLTSVGSWQRKNNYFLFLYMCIVIVTLTFGVCTYGK